MSYCILLVISNQTNAKYHALSGLISLNVYEGEVRKKTMQEIPRETEFSPRVNLWLKVTFSLFVCINGFIKYSKGGLVATDQDKFANR